MIGATIYIIVCSARNRLRRRLRRLREPRYLIGAIFGLIYLYFTVFARLRTFGSGRRGARGGAPWGGPITLTGLGAAGTTAAGLGLLATTAISWIMPFESGLLQFSDAEIQFLFPAPVSRRGLLVYRMLRSQLGLLFTAVIASIFLPSASGYGRVRTSIAMWIFMVTAKLYFTGVTLARTRLAARSARSRRLAWLPIGVLGIAIAIVLRAVSVAYAATPPVHLSDVFAMLDSISSAGPSRVVLWPFMALARPLFAEWPGPYLSALAGSAIVLAATMTWVLLSDSAFHEAANESVERRAQQPSSKRASYRVRSGGWTLAPAGRPEAAFAWKAAMQTLRIVDRGALFRSIAIIFALTMIALSIGRNNGVAAMIGIFGIAGTLFTILMAPQVIRIDFRQDLRHLDLLKTWPVPSGAIVRGEIAWPGAAITIVSWVSLAVALALSPATLGSASLAWRASGAAAIALLAPGIVFAQLTIHNAIALIFPAWVPLGNQRQRGLDAMGQRLIMLAGTWLLLAVMMLPGAVAGGVVWFVMQLVIGVAAVVPAAAVCTTIVGLEVLAATEALGPAYERLDVLAVEPGSN
jgi:ABC-2 type transport system permease protein